MSEKASCDNFRSGKCPSFCPGLLGSKTIKLYDDIAVDVQVCPNPDNSGSGPTDIDYCGSSNDVVIVHRDSFPAQDEFTKYANNFGQ